MNLALVGSTINIIISFFFLLSRDYDIEFSGPMVACGSLSVIGWLVMHSKKKVGAAMTIAGAIPFMPLGLIAIFGAIKVLKGEKTVETWDDNLDL